MSTVHAAPATKLRYRSPTVYADVEVSLSEFSTDDIAKELAHRRGKEEDDDAAAATGEPVCCVPRDDLEALRNSIRRGDAGSAIRTAQRIYCDALGAAF